MGRRQANFPPDQDVYDWFQSISLGLRARAFNRACREAAAKGEQWIRDLAVAEPPKRGYQSDKQLGNPNIASED